MQQLILASNNAHKIDEIKSILTGMQVLSLKEANVFIEVEEDKDTLEGNALKKAKEIYDVTGIPVISDDTGLFVDALNGEPGVYSARYAGENVTYADNCNKLIAKLKKLRLESSPAVFRSVICYYISPEEHDLFEGALHGKITTTPRGTNGFGYDPLFIPEGYEQTFAELTSEEKNKISHRASALQKLKDFLR